MSNQTEPKYDFTLTGVQVDDPVMLANMFLEDQDQPILYFEEKWYQYTGTHYEVQGNTAISGRVAAHIEAWFMRDYKARLADVIPTIDDNPIDDINPKKLPRKKKCTDGIVSNVLSRLAEICNRRVAKLDKLPTWLNGEQRDVLAMANGLLDPITRDFIPFTPEYFNTSVGTFTYDTNAKCPQWESFLNQQWEQDQESKQALAEWFGLMLTKITRFQKALLLQGPPRSGKGTICRILHELVGDELAISADATKFSNDFGQEKLINKTVLLFPELRIGKGADLNQFLTIVLSLTGEDQFGFNRKQKTEVVRRHPIRISFFTNLLQNFNDQSAALVPRLLILKHPLSFAGKEDTKLTERLRIELPGILNWALDGLSRLLARGKFEQPASSLPLLERFKKLNDRVGQCLKDRFVFDPEARIPKPEAREAYSEWCEDEGIPYQYRLSGPHLTEALKETGKVGEVFPRPPKGKKRVRYYTGIRLRTETDPEPEPDEQ